MTKVTLANVGNIIDATTAETNINNNSAAIVTAVENTLSRDGTAPNQMQAPLDMNDQQILNLPQPTTDQSPLRLTDLNSFIGGGTISTVPTGGTTLQALSKASNANYDMIWDDVVQSVGLSMPTDFTVTNSPVTSSGTLTTNWATTPTGTGAVVRATSPTLVTPALGTPSAVVLTNGTGLPISSGVSGLGAGVGTFLANPNSANLATALTDETGSGANVFATSPTLVTPVLGTPTSGTLTNCTGLPVTGVTGMGTNVNTFLVTPTSANLAAALTDETGTGANVFATSPTITTPNIVGTTAVGNAAAGSLEEYVSSIIASGSPVTMTTGTGVNITSISLTAGDWDVWTSGFFIPAATTNITQLIAGWSLVSGTLSLVADRIGITTYQSAGIVPGVVNMGVPLAKGRLNISSTTTVYLIGLPTFTVAGLTAWGSIQARRVR